MNYLLNAWLLISFILIGASLLRAPQIGSANSLQRTSENKGIDQLLIVCVFLFFLFAILIGMQTK